MNVLFTGSGEFYHLEPLAKCLKAAAPDLRLGGHGLWNYEKNGVKTTPSKSPYFDYLSGNITLHQPKKTVFKELRQWRSHFIEHVSQGKCDFLISGIKDVIHTAKIQRKIWCASKKFSNLPESPDLIHLQSLFITDAVYWLLSQNDRPFVVSCWGSDVLRISDHRVMKLQAEILERSAAITCTGPEFKEVLLAKFGRHLESKIFNTYFNPKVESTLDTATKPDEGISKKIMVCLGHNGFAQGNHLEMLEGISTLNASVKERVVLKIPMTYGAPADYLEQVKNAADHTGCRYEILTDYMSDSEVSAFRQQMDVLAFVPVSDAFSATVSQALAVGSVVIMGEWLPNRLRRQAGFYFHETSSARNVAPLLQEIVLSWPEEMEKSRRNQDLAKMYFSEQNIGREWIKVYQKALNQDI